MVTCDQQEKVAYSPQVCKVCNLNEFSIATRFDVLAGLAGRSTIENLSPIFYLNFYFFIKTSW